MVDISRVVTSPKIPDSEGAIVRAGNKFHASGGIVDRHHRGYVILVNLCCMIKVPHTEKCEAVSWTVLQDSARESNSVDELVNSLKGIDVVILACDRERGWHHR